MTDEPRPPVQRGSSYLARVGPVFQVNITLFMGLPSLTAQLIEKLVFSWQLLWPHSQFLALLVSLHITGIHYSEL